MPPLFTYSESSESGEHFHYLSFFHKSFLSSLRFVDNSYIFVIEIKINKYKYEGTRFNFFVSPLLITIIFLAWLYLYLWVQIYKIILNHDLISYIRTINLNTFLIFNMFYLVHIPWLYNN